MTLVSQRGVKVPGTEVIGMLRIYEAYHKEGRVVLLAALCPACDYEHGFRVDAEWWASANSYGPRDVWEFNGDYEKPTFSPSMLANKDGHPGAPRCHSFLRDGVWQYLEDSTHELAGQHIPVIPPKA